MGSEKERTIFEKFMIYMEHDTRGVELLTYGIAGVGLLIATRRIRPFARFTKPSQVPTRFLKSRTPMRGAAVRIEPNEKGPFIMIDHKPLVPLPRLGKRTYLPVKVAGVKVTNLGISWLQTIVSGKEVTLIPLVREKDFLECMIRVAQQKDKEPLQVGQELVRLGFGTVDKLRPDLSKEKEIAEYQKSLIAGQKWAVLKRNGHWHFAIDPTFLWKIRSTLSEKMRSLLPTFLARRLSI